jgi:hypothetical protein
MVSACSNSKPMLIDEIKNAMSKANMDFQELHHIELVDKGVIVFYKRMDALHEGFIELKDNKWHWVFGGGGAEYAPSKGASWQVTNVRERNVQMASGVITDPKIVKVTLNGENAKIVSSNGTRIWFVIPQNSISTFKVIATTSDNRDIQIN